MVRAASSAPKFISNEDLTSRLPNDDGGNVKDLPVADHIFMGIVCVDISRCSSTPKSLTDASGYSGKSWLDFLRTVDLLTFEERPTTITLECVENLRNNRTVQGHREKWHYHCHWGPTGAWLCGTMAKGFSNTLSLATEPSSSLGAVPQGEQGPGPESYPGERERVGPSLRIYF